MSEKPTRPLAWLFRSHPETVFDYLEFRQVVARMAGRLASERATEEDRCAMTQAFNALCAAHEKNQPEAEAEADTSFHLAIYRATHNAFMSYIMERLLTMLRDDVFYDRQRLYSRPEIRKALLDQHRALYQAVMARKPDEAVAAAIAHIRFAGEALHDIQEADHRLAVSKRRVSRELDG